MKINKIHAGRANMFLSPIFRDTLASVSGATIDLYDTDGAVGAAKGAGIGAGIYKSTNEAFASLRKLDEIHPANDPAPYLEAYARWKSYLNKQL
jgi:xylulokinase